MKDAAPQAAAVQRSVLYTVLLFLVLVIIGWLPLVPALHLAPTRLSIFEKAHRMGDLFNATAQMQHFSALTIGPTFNYPAPAAFAVAFFLRSSHPKILFTAAVVGAVAVAAALLFAGLRRGALRPWLAATTCLCFAALGTPQIFALDRANLEWVGWLLVVLAMVCLYTGRYLPMALLLGLAVCMKPFPVVLFALLLYRRKYKEIAAGVLLAATVMLVALRALGPSIPETYRSLQPGMLAYKTNYIQSVRLLDEMRFDHALMSPVRLLLFHWYGSPRMEPMHMAGAGLPVWARLDLWQSIFSVIAVGGILLTAWFARRLPTINQVLLLCLTMTLFPYIASEYTLLILYVPFGLVLLWMARDVSQGEAPLPPFALLALFALLFAPLGMEFHFLVGLAQCVLLLALFVAAWRVPMPMRVLDQAPRETP